jgi:SAM-dependent methyltransferase
MDHDAAAAMAGHWWYRGRAAAVSSLLARAGARPGGRVLDYGCGTGHMGRTLARFGEVWGVDAEQQAIDAGHASGAYGAYVSVGRATIGDDGMPAGPFAVVACLDVLEHVSDDERLLAGLADLLAPDGVLVVSVPLRPELFCDIDRLSGHYRRYSPERLERLFAAAGLRPVAASGYVVALLPPAAAHRRRLLAGRGTAADEFARPSAPVNAALSMVAVAEGRLARYVGLPPGLSQITVLRRSGDPAGASGVTQPAAADDASGVAQPPAAAVPAGAPVAAQAPAAAANAIDETAGGGR